MTQANEAARKLKDLLGLEQDPVAISFVSEVPDGVPALEDSAVSSCSYWKAGAEKTFATDSSHHVGCAVGAHTHGVKMSAEVQQELQSMVSTMVDLKYLTMEEVPGIAHRKDPFQHAVYGPAADTDQQPDVVLVSGSARQMMILSEAVRAEDLSSERGWQGRPTCALIPESIESQRCVGSFGCIGNRVYTGLPDGDLYLAIPGGHLGRLTERLATLVEANNALESFHRARLSP